MNITPRKPHGLPVGVVLIGLFVLTYLAMSGYRAANVSRDVPFVDADALRAMRTGETPVLVEFWASWCGYCRALDPALSRLARHYAGRLTVVRVDYDANLAVRTEYAVAGVPLVLVLRQGKMLARRQGGMSEDALFDFVARALNAAGDSGKHSPCVPGPLGMPICE